MWKLAEVDSESQYVVQLCHEITGRRYFRLRATTIAERGADVIFETDIVPNELLKTRNMARIAQSVKLSNGGTFEVDAHNIWLMPEELEAIEENDDVDSIRWCTATPPIFAPI